MKYGHLNISDRLTACMMLLVAVLASLLQFHHHDCLGHIDIDIAITDISLGCNHHDHEHYNIGHQDNDRHNHTAHQESGSDCAMHINISTSEIQNIQDYSPKNYVIALSLLPAALLLTEEPTKDINPIPYIYHDDSQTEFWCDYAPVIRPMRGSPIA